MVIPLIRKSIRLSAILLMCSTLPAYADESVSQGDSLQVKVRSTALRGEAKPWSTPVTFANYGDKLTVVAIGGGWVKAKNAAGKEGYVHTSAITTKKVVLGTEGLSDNSADATDVVMAGKGFSKKVEEAYAASMQGLNFKAVDAMERWKVKAAELASFLKDGKLGDAAS